LPTYNFGLYFRGIFITLSGHTPLTAYLGELAALTTALCWSFTAIFFTLAGRAVGSVMVNRLRLLLALIFLILTHWLLLARPLPLTAEPERWFWLGLSGIIGLVLGDAFLFQAYVWVGPRLGMLMMSLVPVLSTLTAWVFLGETLAFSQLAGILLTVGGIAWVIFERSGPAKDQTEARHYVWGILFGLGAATGQALGLITAKKGLGGDFPALSGNLIRMLTAAGVMWTFTLVQGQARPTMQRLLDSPRAARLIVGGAFTGPFIGVWLSLVAIQLTHIGIASTLMALPPVFLLPIGYFVFKEQITWRAVAGTVVAMSGVAVLFLV
jgi:drug/metabolite transporter (DMT)-like permease